MFKAGSREDAASETIVEATIITPEPAKAEAKPEPTPEAAAEKAALQDIVISQAMKIQALEAEIAKLKAQAAKAKARKA